MPHWLSSTLTLVVVLTASTNAAPKDENTLAAVKCLSEAGDLAVACPKANQKVKVKSVAFAHSGENCNTPVPDNDCIQIIPDLTEKARGHCDGVNSCLVPVVTLAKLVEQQRESRVLVETTITGTRETCTVNGYLEHDLPMDTFQVLFECEEYAFCNKLDDTVTKLTLATKEWPAKTVTNPTCGCTFETTSSDDYFINGYVHCNGSVTFVTEEWYTDGSSEKLEYSCANVSTPGYMLLATKDPYKISVTVDQEKSDEESAYEISWMSVKHGTGKMKLDAPITVSCEEGKFWLPYRVQLILQIVLPIVGVVLIALIVVYCIIKKRREKAKDWRARHVRLPPSSSQMGTMEMAQSGFLTHSPSEESFSYKKQERVDPEGNVDDIGEYAAQLKKQNEERRKKQLEKRQQGYQRPSQPAPPSPPRTPPPSRSSIQPNRRAQSYGNLRSDRRYNYADNMDSPMESKPLAYSKSASQSRASVRSLKKRAPQPTGPPQVAPPHYTTGRSSRPSRASSTASIHRNRSRNTSQPALYSPQPPNSTLPSRNPPHYATPQPIIPVDPGYPDQDPDNSDDEDMTVMRPRTKPPVTAPKPKLPPKQNPRYPSSANSSRNITPAALGELQRELENSD